MPPRKRTTRATKKAETSADESIPDPVTTQANADDVPEEVEQSVQRSPSKRSLKQKKPTENPVPDEDTPKTNEAVPPRADEQEQVLAVAEVEEDEAKEASAKVVTDKDSTKQSVAPAVSEITQDTTPFATSAPSAADRMARFKALQARAKTSSDQNLKAAAAETQRLSTDASQLNSLRRKVAVVSHKILKAEVEEEGGDFERKRAWDWTAEESERWDKRMKKKAAHRDNAAFQDYTQEAGKVYKKQIRNAAALAAPDLEQYARDKLAAVERAAAAGTLEIVETADGELIAVDKDGTFFSTAESTSFADNRPSKEAIDRLVNDQKKADEASLRKRRERMAKNGEDADVTYIHEKNKHFNQKLARFYNKYTTEIRESFERGTMI